MIAILTRCWTWNWSSPEARPPCGMSKRSPAGPAAASRPPATALAAQPAPAPVARALWPNLFSATSALFLSVVSLKLFSFLFSILTSMRFSHLHRRSHQLVINNLAVRIQTPERQHSRRAHLHASRAPHALRILHGHSFIRKIHHINSLMANRRAHIARNT